MIVDDCWDLFFLFLFLIVMTQTLDTRTATEDLTIGPTITSGGVYLATNASRSGLINIGHSSSSGSITINAGSSELTLLASNYVQGISTIGISDESGNTATVTGNIANDYIRIGGVVILTIELNITNISTLTGTDEVRITGLPFSHHAGDEHMVGHCAGGCFDGMNYTDVNVFGIAETTTCRIIGDRFVNSIRAPIICSDLALGTLRTTMTYFTTVVV
jgi:hypothetical protein